MDTLEVAYILLRFPILTETFVADEIWEMQQKGVRVHIFSILKPQEGPVQHTSKQLAQDAQYAPELSSWRLWWAQLYFFFRSPITYLALFVDLIRQPYPKSFWFFFSRRMVIFVKAVALAYALRNTSVQLLHTHFAWLSGAASRVISKLLGIPFTVTVHAYDIYDSNDLLCLTARSASQIIAISEYNKKMVLEMCPGVSKDLIAVIHCGINVELFAPPDRSNHKGALSILSVGSLIPKKGHDYLISACQQLQAKGIDFRCMIIGGGPREEALKQLVRDCDLEDRVVLAGTRRREEVLDAYQCSDLFILASVVAKSGDRDGIPVVIMEAMAMNLPVISTKVSGIPELVRHEQTGWLVPERDAAAIADAVARLADDEVLRTRLGRNGRTLIEQAFEIKGNVSQLRDVFRQVVEQSGT